MKIAFLNLLKTENLKTPLKNVKKMKTMLCAESPNNRKFDHIRLEQPKTAGPKTIITDIIAVFLLLAIIAELSNSKLLVLETC